MSDVGGGGLTSHWLVNSSRYYLRRRIGDFARTIEDGALVLDAGAGQAPYSDLFAHVNYESADFEKVNKRYAESTYVCDLKEIPVENNRFDHVLFSQVMEHLPEPLTVLSELFRVLKPGGSLFCSCPLFFPEHEQPFDYYRYTQFAHRHLFEKVGFEVTDISWLEGYLGTVAFQMEFAYRNLPLNPLAKSNPLLGWTLSPLMAASKVAAFLGAGVFSRIDRVSIYSDKGMPKNYVIVVRKPL